MTKTFRLAVAAVMLSGVVSSAHAEAILTGSILNNGQVIGPNDSITFEVRIANSGDAAFSSGWAVAEGAYALPNNYPTFDFPTGGYPLFEMTPLAAGDMFDFYFFTLFPAVGGAAAGHYVGDGGFRMYFYGNTVVEFGTAQWEVVAVPEPTTLALLGLGLAGLGFSRRKQ